MTNTARFAILFGLSLCSGAALSAGKSDDSVHAWGRWDQMISPAAGPGVSTSFVAQAIPESQDLRPDESQAFSREVIGPTSSGGGGPGGGGLDLPDVSDPLPGTPIGSAPPTPAPPPPDFPLGDVTDPSGGGIGTAPPTPAPPPPGLPPLSVAQ